MIKSVESVYVGTLSTPVYYGFVQVPRAEKYTAVDIPVKPKYFKPSTQAVPSIQAVEKMRQSGLDPPIRNI